MSETTNYLCQTCGKVTHSGDIHTCTPPLASPSPSAPEPRAGNVVPCGEPFCSATAMYCSRHAASPSVGRAGEAGTPMFWTIFIDDSPPVAINDNFYASENAAIENHAYIAALPRYKKRKVEIVPLYRSAAPQRGEVTEAMVKAAWNEWTRVAPRITDGNERMRYAITAALSSQRERK